MRKFSAAIIIIMLAVPIFMVSLRTTEAAPTLPPLAPHDVKVLVVSPSNLYFRGGGYLISDLASYGFDVTQQTSDSSSVDYLTDPKTANLNQYDVVILHGSYFGQSPTKVSFDELRHFTRYGGVLIFIGNALFVNETSGTWWNDFFFSFPLQTIEQRFGVIITRYLKDTAAGLQFHNNGTFNLVDTSIPGLPTSLNYVRGTYGSSQFQMELGIADANLVYDFQTQSGGITTTGVTFYRNATGAVGIFIQGAYVYAEQPGTNQIKYLGMTEKSKRQAFLASLVAYALNKDITTVVKPQPLANVRLDGLGQTYDEFYLNASLSYFDDALDRYNITPTIGFIDYLDFKSDYWQRMAPRVLSQLRTIYRDWEYSTTLRYYTNLPVMTQGQIEALINNIRGNYSSLGLDLFSTAIAPSKGWNQSTLDAMSSKNLYLLDIPDTYYADWWSLRINSSVIVHSGVQMLPEYVVINGTRFPAEDFAQPGLDTDSINNKYFSRRDKIALAVLNGFPSFVYYVPNFRWNKIGTYSLETVVANLGSEMPDIRFVPLIEAGLYFGNKWMRIQNAVRAGSVVEFDVDASAVPNVVNIGKGMLWLRINANESIQEVSINNNGWFYFDEHSIRIPTPDTPVHVRVVLGSSPSPRVDTSRYKVVEASYDGHRLNVSINAAQNLNVTVRLSLPQIGAFSKEHWSVLCLEETEWNYSFNSTTRTLEFWTISDGSISFQVGLFWIINQTPAWYNSSVTISANFSGLEVEINEVTFSYNFNGPWTNVTTELQGDLWVAKIPALAYGTAVSYKLFAHASSGKWFTTEIFNYVVTDQTLPEIDKFEWGPNNPSAGQPVSVKVVLSEPQNASGVKDAVLWYYTGTQLTDIAQAKTIAMANQSGTWVGEIPGQGGGAVVTFYVVAQDNAGNRRETSHLGYSVWILPISPTMLLLIGGAVAAVGVGVALYFRRFRGNNQKAETK